jgi:hypothetical protein
MLKVQTQIVHRVDYNDLEEFIQEEYGHSISIVADLESSNDSAETFSIVKKEILSRWDLEKVEKFKATGDYDRSTSALLQDLVNRDLAPEGNYVIDICW